MKSKTDLDDLELYKKLDPDDMLGKINELPKQCQQAWQSAMDFELPASYTTVDRVVIVGMGGSAIGGDMAKGLIASEARLPVIVHRDYGLPAFVDPMTLVIAVSYSGNTEETLSAFDRAVKAGAKTVAVTTGGRLRPMASQRHIPVFVYDYKSQPRAALGYGLMPVLGFLQKLGFLRDKSADVAETVRVLGETAQANRETVPTAGNAAKQMAQRLHGCLPVVYGAGVLAEVAHRWKTQVNENSKAWAFYEAFSELDHNAVAGYQFPEELAAKIRVILLRSRSFDSRLQLRYRVTAELLEKAGVAFEYADAAGTSPLSQVLSLAMFGDYVSYYLAILNGTDPSAVKAIDYLKSELAKG